MTRPLRWVGVVVPARDEEDLLPGCLRALDVARREAGRRHGVEVDVAVVLDACRDRSADVVAGAPGVLAVPGPGLGVGPARAAGAAALLRRHRHRAAEVGWLATTDADSRVPADWLVRQVSLADAGADVVLGSVVVDDGGGLPESARRQWQATYVARDGHGHVHGANAGLRLDTYLAVGGFADLDRDEDVALAAATAHRRVVRTASIPVVTSARLRSRAPGGFAEHLARLA